ncbi:MAG: NifB/NifX family molybdenum-iron cluster-binding protein [Methanoregulaceae archaeon]|nr:NifB/NifX family molybdenum-iron cluster-binding protein [Methanoregulaceae archaeon]MCC7467882.1 NifB/NifX family molybdenum-iron cluster-binding protein [Burkholderiaceae bacterium]NLH26606.1 dinitrogenase iron-molybdenum cofactor biosynthesis protein [Methanomicrobiales archaeon]HOU80273.1 NifB/NifX family molybdenum-iron cluster-binding protein [Methanoregulaceae archaeon]HPS23539.1 NifB/NifX family molybdenum-iron cluster-binding protein [Methanoregulaceae archaeon]
MSGSGENGTRRVAIAVDGNGVSSHFGHCEKFTVYHIRNREIFHHEIILNPGHEPGKLPRLLASCGVTDILAGGMGMKAVQLFEEQGIHVMCGITGPVDQVIRAFCEDRITAGESTCHHLGCDE